MKYRAIRIWVVKFFFGDSEEPFLERFFLFRCRAKAFARELSRDWLEFEEAEQIKVRVKMERLWI